eukprot:UN00940
MAFNPLDVLGVVKKAVKKKSTNEPDAPYCPKSGCNEKCNWSPPGKRISVSVLGSRTCDNEDCDKKIKLKTKGIYCHEHDHKVYFLCPFCNGYNSVFR